MEEPSCVEALSAIGRNQRPRIYNRQEGRRRLTDLFFFSEYDYFSMNVTRLNFRSKIV